MFISPSLLDRVYQRGSLKNVEGGFEFKLKNLVDNGTLSGVKSLTVDGSEVPLADVRFQTSAGEKLAEEISYRSPLPFYYNAEATIRVVGQTLEAGAHVLVLTISVYEAGTLQLKISDEIV
jgi:hypothetical protein